MSTKTFFNHPKGSLIFYEKTDELACFEILFSEILSFLDIFFRPKILRKVSSTKNGKLKFGHGLSYCFKVPSNLRKSQYPVWHYYRALSKYWLIFNTTLKFGNVTSSVKTKEM